jgi:hypothetical protein
MAGEFQRRIVTADCALGDRITMPFSVKCRQQYLDTSRGRDLRFSHREAASATVRASVILIPNTEDQVDLHLSEQSRIEFHYGYFV